MSLISNEHIDDPQMLLEAWITDIHTQMRHWWVDLDSGKFVRRDRPTLFALMHSEVSEGLEGFRKSLKDDKLPHRDMLEVELADYVIRLLDYLGGYDKVLLLSHPIISGQFKDIGDITTLDDLCKACRPLPSPNASNSLRQQSSSALFGYLHMMISYALDDDHFVLEQSKESVYLLCSLGIVGMFLSRFDYNLEATIMEKMAVNAKRADHKADHRRQENGKKF